MMLMCKSTWSDCRTKTRTRSSSATKPNYVGWSDYENKPHLVLYAEHFTKDWIQVTRDRVIGTCPVLLKVGLALWPVGLVERTIVEADVRAGKKDQCLSTI